MFVIVVIIIIMINIVMITTIIIKATQKKWKLKVVSHSNHMQPNSQGMKHKLLSNHF